MMPPTNIGNVEIRTVVSDRNHQPYLHLLVYDTDDNAIGMGQLDPTTVRDMATQFLDAAAAAELDAGIYTILSRGGAPTETIAALIAELRDWRAKREEDDQT